MTGPLPTAASLRTSLDPVTVHFSKLRGVPWAEVDGVLGSLTEAEWNWLEEAYIDACSQLIYDWLSDDLGLHEDVDSSLLFCKLYHLSLQKTEEATDD